MEFTASGARKRRAALLGSAAMLPRRS